MFEKVLTTIHSQAIKELKEHEGFPLYHVSRLDTEDME